MTAMYEGQRTLKLGATENAAIVYEITRACPNSFITRRFSMADN